MILQFLKIPSEFYLLSCCSRVSKLFEKL